MAGDRRLAIVGAVLFAASCLFPTVAGLLGNPSTFSRWWGVADVALALVVVILAFVIVGRAGAKVTARAREASYRAYRILLHAILLLLVLFFLVGGRIVWFVWLTGFAWRGWLLLYSLPAWFMAMGRGATEGVDVRKGGA
jgi:hypothetical protein